MKKIFISSTCYDLIDLRAELNKYLSEYNFDVIMSDQLESNFEIGTNDNSIETCLINLRKCDIVIFVLCQRYGPRLGKLSFENISATHLEYKEAVKSKKQIFFYVRDRLDADLTIYEKNKTLQPIKKCFSKKEKKINLNWVTIEKDYGLFQFIKERRTLTNSEKDNWYWSFKNSVELKDRIRIDLKEEIASNQLDILIKEGKVPFLLVKKLKIASTNSNASIDFEIKNIGETPAIDVITIVTKANSYEQIINDEYYNNILNYDIHLFDYISKNETENFSERFIYNPSIENTFFIESIYKTTTKESLSDIIKLKLSLSKITNQIEVKLSYHGKRYLTNNSYKLIHDKK